MTNPTSASSDTLSTMQLMSRSSVNLSMNNSNACIRARIASCLKHGSHFICAGTRSASARLRCPLPRRNAMSSACTSMLAVSRRICLGVDGTSAEVGLVEGRTTAEPQLDRKCILNKQAHAVARL
jgi:hypothetical protein